MAGVVARTISESGEWSFYRGVRPKSHKELVDMGVKTVIVLQSGFSEEIHDDQYEKELPRDFGIESVSIACSDFFPPKDHEVRKAMRAITLASHENKSVYIHCLHGKDRTGFMCAVYRMKYCGWSYKQAKREMFSYGFHKFPYLTWLPTLSKWERKSIEE